jgi:hypothetical protein
MTTARIAVPVWHRRGVRAVGGPGGDATDVWRTASALVAVVQPLAISRRRAVGGNRWLSTDGHGPDLTGGRTRSGTAILLSTCGNSLYRVAM